MAFAEPIDLDLPPPVDMLSHLRYPNNPFQQISDIEERVTNLETFYDDSPARAFYAVDVNNVNVPTLVTTLTGVFAWNPTDTSATGETTTTLPFLRAAVGDHVLVSFSQPLPAYIILQGVVTQPGVVQVALINFTGTSVTIQPGNLRITVLHYQ